MYKQPRCRVPLNHNPTPRRSHPLSLNALAVSPLTLDLDLNPPVVGHRSPRDPIIPCFSDLTAAPPPRRLSSLTLSSFLSHPLLSSSGEPCEFVFMSLAPLSVAVVFLIAVSALLIF